MEINKISEVSKNSKEEYFENIKLFLSSLDRYYPRHNEWITEVFQRVLNSSSEREIIFTTHNNDISSCAILKKMKLKKKSALSWLMNAIETRGLERH